MKRRDLLNGVSATTLALFAPRVPKQWSAPDPERYLLLHHTYGPSMDRGGSGDDLFVPRYYSLPPGTPPVVLISDEELQCLGLSLPNTLAS